ncbi:hypothetical protein F2Q69_00043860 [Brassica cretica]|uniref:Uncharacterized protein n=1 Tax=Brassica cretica TaxID=69181 RepID=A0A8S9NKJ5_BRACR|nr:hypothetical protein F2Q69_00043860 [Brassica cretica]
MESLPPPLGSESQKIHERFCVIFEECIENNMSKDENLSHLSSSLSTQKRKKKPDLCGSGSSAARERPVSLETSSHVRSSVSGVDCEGWSDGAGSVYSQAEESAFRAVQGAPLTPWRAVGVSPSVSSAVFGLSWSRRAMVVWCRFSVLSWASRSGGICSTCDLRASEVRLLEGVCSSCCRRVSEHAVVLREVLLRSGVGGVVHGVSKAMLRPSSQSSSLFPSIRCRQAERVDLLLLGLTPACVCSSFILATGCCFRRQELTFTRFSEEATFEGLERLCLSAESSHPSVAWSVEAALPSAVSLLSSWWCCFSNVFAGLGVSSASFSCDWIKSVFWRHRSLAQRRSPRASYFGNDMEVPGIRGNEENLTVPWSSFSVRTAIGS